MQAYVAQLAAANERNQQLARLARVACKDAELAAGPSNLCQTGGRSRAPAGLQAARGDACTARDAYEAVPSGQTHTAGGSREAAMMSDMLMRLDRNSSEFGMGRKEIFLQLELLNKFGLQVADAMIASNRATSGISDDYVMPPSNTQDQTRQSSSDRDSDLEAHVHRLDVSTQIMQIVFNILVSRPLSAVEHRFSNMEHLSQAADMPEAFLASLWQGEACREVYTELMKARNGSSSSWNGVIQRLSLVLRHQLDSVSPSFGIDVKMLMYQSLLVGCMVPAVVLNESMTRESFPRVFAKRMHCKTNAFANATAPICTSVENSRAGLHSSGSQQEIQHGRALLDATATPTETIVLQSTNCCQLSQLQSMCHREGVQSSDGAACPGHRAGT